MIGSYDQINEKMNTKSSIVSLRLPVFIKVLYQITSITSWQSLLQIVIFCRLTSKTMV